MACIPVSPETAPPNLRCVAFNHDTTAFVAGTDSGFSVYCTDPFMRLRTRRIAGGVRLVAMCGLTHLVALCPSDTRTTVVLWDDLADNGHGRAIASADFPFPVTAVRMLLHAVVVVEGKHAHIFDARLKLIASFNVHANAPGCVAIAPLPATAAAPGHSVGHKGQRPGAEFVVALPGSGEGLMQFAFGEEEVVVSKNRHNRQLVTHRTETQIKAQVAASPHNHRVGAVTLSPDGSVCATASEQGTAVKLTRTKDGAVLRQLNRGALANKILSLAISPGGAFLACVSETGTAHAFALKQTNAVGVANGRSVLAHVANTVADAGGDGGAARALSRAAGSVLSSAVSFAQGEFAFATFNVASAAPTHTPTGRFFNAALVAWRTGAVVKDTAVLYVAQADWGRFLRVGFDVGRTSGASTLLGMAPFPDVDL